MNTLDSSKGNQFWHGTTQSSVLPGNPDSLLMARAGLMGRREWLVRFAGIASGVAVGTATFEQQTPAQETPPLGVEASGAENDEPVSLAGESPAPLEALQIQNSRGEQQELLGRVIVAAPTVEEGSPLPSQDWLLQTRDGRLWQIPPQRLVSRRGLEKAFQPSTAEELGRELVQQFGSGFQCFVSEHCIVCTNASDAYARWCSELLERLGKAFRAYWKQRGVVTREPEFPLVAILFQKQGQFAEFAIRDVGPEVAEVPGYFSILSNRIVLRDLTESSGGQPVRSPAEIEQRLASRLANVATMVHEATHQIAFNSGLHTRLADNPVWLTEGMAIFFETPDLRSKTGWKTAGQLNRPRLKHFQTYVAQRRESDALRNLIQDDTRLTTAESAADAYAEAWALTYFLIRKRSANYLQYLALLTAKAPLVPGTREQRLQEFEQTFGALQKLENEFLAYMRTLR